MTIHDPDTLDYLIIRGAVAELFDRPYWRRRSRMLDRTPDDPYVVRAQMERDLCAGTIAVLEQEHRIPSLAEVDETKARRFQERVSFYVERELSNIVDLFDA